MQKRAALIAIAALTTVAIGALVGPLIVQSDSVTLRRNPDAISPSVGDAFPRGTSFNLLEERGRFARVRSGITEGWLRVADLEPRKFMVPGAQVGRISGSTEAGQAQESASGKGLGDGVNDIATSYSAKSGVPTLAFEALLKQRKEIVDSGEARRFADQGQVGKR